MAVSPQQASRASGSLVRVGVSLLIVVALFGCAKPVSPPAETAMEKPAPSTALFELGRRTYEKQCAVCHGASGRGDGQAAFLLYPKPRDFTQNEFRLVSTSTMQATDEDLFLTITRGMPGSAMPSWESLTPEQRWALVYYVRYLTKAPQAPDAEPVSLMTESIDPASIIPVPPESARTPESIARGRQLFAEACAACHGALGKGDGQQVTHGHTDNAGFPIKPRDLTAGIFKGSSESPELYTRIVAGLPGSPMPSYAGVYSDEQLWDLIHYVQSLVPEGVEERVRLRAVSLRARKISAQLPEDPSAPAWEDAAPVEVALTPLWWRDQRAEEVRVSALHNGKELAVRLAWNDPTQDSSLGKPQSFSDGAAIQLSTEQDPPFFGMGDGSGAVHIWHWKAAWQEDMAGWRDIETTYPSAAVDWYPAQTDYRHGDPFEVSQAKTASQDPQLMSGWGADNPLSTPQRSSAAEEVMAKGLGTVTSRPPTLQRVQAAGVWRDGEWQVVLRRPIGADEGQDLAVRPGQSVQVAFAIWDGHAEDRNGQKSVSVWNTLQLER